MEKPKSKSSDISVEEVVGTIFFCIVILLTNNAVYGFSAGLVTFALMSFLTHHLKKLNHKKIKKNSVKLFVILAIFFVVDMLLTYYAVHYMKIAEEMNLVALFLWNNFGLFFGELIRISGFWGLMAFLFVKMRKEKQNIKHNKIAITIVYVLIFGWVVVVINNIYQIITYFS